MLGNFDLGYLGEVCDNCEAYEVLSTKKARLIPWKDILFEIYQKISDEDPNFSKIQKAKDEDPIISSYDGFYRKIHSILDDVRGIVPFIGNVSSPTM